MSAPSPTLPPLLVGLAALVGFVMVAAWAIQVAPDRIQAQVQRNAQDAVRAAGVPGVRVQATGRQIKAIGAVDSQSDRERAVAAIAAAPGVAGVDGNGIVVGRTGTGTATLPPPPRIAAPGPGSTPPSAPAETAATPPPQPQPPAAAASSAGTTRKRSASSTAAARRGTAAAAAAPPSDSCAAQASRHTGTELPFSAGSAVLRGSAVDTLDAVRQILVACPSTFLRLRGHANDRGTSLGNHELSAARAQAAAEWLHRQGIPDRRMLTTWAGDREQRPRPRRGVGLRLYDGGAP